MLLVDFKERYVGGLMNKKTKLALALGSAFLTLSIGIVIFTAEYYVDVAIKRNKKKFSNKKRRNKSLRNTNKTMIKDMIKVHSQMVEKSNLWQKEVSSEDIFITANDGIKLFGKLYENENSNKYVLIAHGYNCSLTDMLCYGPEFYEQGYNVLFIDMRAHGKSEGDYIGMGWLERIDIKKWCEYLVEKNPNAKIALFGQSMGAAAVMMASGEDLPKNVCACIEDSGYTSVGNIYKTILKETYHLPSFPLLNTANLKVKKKAGYSFFDADACKQLAKSTIPTLFIHAEKDSFVPFENVIRLYTVANEPKEIYTVKGAEHVCAAFYKKDEYFKKVFSFLDKYVN